MVGGAALEWHGSINCTILFTATGRVHSRICELLAFCRAQAGINDERHDEQQEGGIRGENAPEIMDAMPIEAAWDVDKTAEVEQQIMVT
jgi:hypothetical protein